MKTIGITGGSGFVGSHLAALLKQRGDHVIIFTRHPEQYGKDPQYQYIYWEPAKEKCDLTALKQMDAVVNLAGTSINRRWTIKAKQQIRSSRVQGTQFLLSKLKKHSPNCKTFLSASAIGYYDAKGHHGNNTNGAPFTEENRPGTDFLADTCIQWETAAHEARDKFRTAIFRFGVVLGKDGGALPQMLSAAMVGVLPVMGGGRQHMSWIQVDDLANMIIFAIDNESIQGAYNAVAPYSVTNKQLMKTIKQEKGGMRMLVHVPSFALKIGLGEMSNELLKSCNVSSSKIQLAGFKFSYPDIGSAIAACLKTKDKAPGREDRVAYS